MKSAYSEAEMRLIRALNADHLLDLFPIRLYEIMMEHCFMENRQDDAARSLRRCMRAFRKGEPFRMTPEWDALISLDETNVKGGE